MKIISQLLFVSMLQITCYLNLLKAFCEGNIQDRYIGCYYGATNDRTGLQQIRLQNNTTLTIELCVRHCLMRNSTYAGLENSKACLCANNFSVMLSDTSCNSLCPGNQSEYCGGANGRKAFYSVYAACQIGFYGRMCDQVCHCKRQASCHRMTGQCLNGCEEKWSGTTCSETKMSEKYIGCFRDNKTRAISHEGPPFANMTVEYCSNICMLRKSSILGLAARAYCMCGEKYAEYGPLEERNCLSRCTGNSLQICGGGWANSVYSVCPVGYYGPKCGDQCHCYNNRRCVFLTGECNSTCKAGWTGNSCNVRDCKTQNGNCSLNETCVSVNLNFATITRCRCLPGFERNVLLDTCQDVDECDLHNCSDASEECSNTVGSFFCNCKKGFQRKYDSCEDVDECSISSPCGGSVICFNTQGSFRCAGVLLEVAVGASVGSALGSAFLVVIIVIGILACRQRRQQNGDSKDSIESRRRAQIDEILENPDSSMTYEALKRTQTQDSSIYAELTSQI